MNNDFYIAVGERIRMVREKRRLSREALAELASISTKFLYEIEVGKKGFSVEILERITRSLDVNYEYILNGTSKTEQYTPVSSVNSELDEKKRKYIEEILLLLYKMLETDGDI